METITTTRLINSHLFGGDPNKERPNAVTIRRKDRISEGIKSHTATVSSKSHTQYPHLNNAPVMKFKEIRSQYTAHSHEIARTKRANSLFIIVNSSDLLFRAIRT